MENELYRQDILLWSESQGELLRRLAGDRDALEAQLRAALQTQLHADRHVV